MESEERDKILKEISELLTEHNDLSNKQADLLHRKDELLKISNDLKEQIQVKAEQEIKTIDNERNFISQKSARDEEVIQRSFQTRLDFALRQKEEMQRKFEAESEYVSRILKERLAKIHQRSLELRNEVVSKVNKSNENLEAIQANESDSKSNNEALIKQRINDIKKYLEDAEVNIDNARKEIEVLNTKGQRYTRILQSLKNQMDEKNAEKKKETPRRKSFFIKKPKLLPE